MPRFNSYSQIPAAFWDIALKAFNHDKQEVRCGTMQKAVALRAEWYHARTYVRNHVPENNAQARGWLEMREVSATIRGSNVVFERSVADLTIQEILTQITPVMDSESAAPSQPIPTVIPDIPTAQETAVEAWFKGEKK